jgi:hypothetical protein
MRPPAILETVNRHILLLSFILMNFTALILILAGFIHFCTELVIAIGQVALRLQRFRVIKFSVKTLSLRLYC